MDKLILLLIIKNTIQLTCFNSTAGSADWKESNIRSSKSDLALDEVPAIGCCSTFELTIGDSSKY